MSFSLMPRLGSLPCTFGPLLMLAVCGCLDPQVSDQVALKGLVLPAGSAVQSAHDEQAIEQQIADSDGVDGTVPLLSAFSGDADIKYWNFGPTADSAAPLFRLVKRNAAGTMEPLPHPAIINSIPGDSAYSPYWAIFNLEASDLYAGELITSFAAIEEAQALGLIYTPTLASVGVNCPIVASNIALEVGEGRAPLKPQHLFYWQGKSVSYYNLGPMPITNGSKASRAALYILSREGREPLSEPIRGVDITGDGDLQDTNNIFAVSKDDSNYTPLVQRVNVTVPNQGLKLIDTISAGERSEIRKEGDLFNPDPVTGTVLAFDRTLQFTNSPQQSSPGGL